jgi:hypothetical protein
MEAVVLPAGTAVKLLWPAVNPAWPEKIWALYISETALAEPPAGTTKLPNSPGAGTVQVNTELMY